MIVKTDAIVLRSMKYRETSRIVRFYTKEYGKISGIVKGARSAKNSFGPALQPLSVVHLVFYESHGKTLHTVSQCDLLKEFRGLTENLEKMYAGMTMIELVSNIVPDEEENKELYDLLLQSLTDVNNASSGYKLFLFRFHVRLAGILGFGPVFDRCVNCGKSVLETTADVMFEFDRGGPVCSNCATSRGPATKISAPILRQISALVNSDEIGIEQLLRDDSAGVGFLEELMSTFYKRHVGGYRPLGTEKALAKILKS